MGLAKDRSGRLRRLLVAAGLLGALLGALAGCGLPEFERGLSGRDAEWARTHGADDFAVVSASHERAVVSALGHRVAVEPAEGFCLATGAIETSDRSAFLLLGDCALEAPEGEAGVLAGGLDLPPGVPGIITVSISGDPGFSPVGGEGELSELQMFLQTADGRALLGRGGDGDQVSVVDTRRIGRCLYVLVEDADGGVPVLAPRFWRAFVELNDRLVVVTISGFRDRPLPEDEMLRYLGDQVRQLQVANSEPIDGAPLLVAEGAEAAPGPEWPSLARRTEEEAIEDEAAREDAIRDGAGAPRIVDIEPTSVIVATDDGAQDFWPVPTRRETRAAPGQDGLSAADGPAPAPRPRP